MKRSRDERALKRKSTWGKVVASGEWAVSEWDALKRFWALGLPVPYPVQIDGTEILMEWITVDGDTAPRLAQTRPDARCWSRYFEQVRDATAMVQNGVVHGDLSAYNLLAAGDRLVIIDLPQIVDLGRQRRRHGLPDARLHQRVRVVPDPRARGRRARPVRGADGARVLIRLGSSLWADPRPGRPCRVARGRSTADWPPGPPRSRGGGSTAWTFRAQRRPGRCLRGRRGVPRLRVRRRRRRRGRGRRWPAAARGERYAGRRGAHALHPGRALRRRGVPPLPRRARLRLGAAPHRPRRHPGAGAARPRDRRGPRGVDGRTGPGRRDGRPRAPPRRRRRTPTRPGSGTLAAARGGDGGGPGAMEAPTSGVAAAPSAGTSTRRCPCWPRCRRSSPRSRTGSAAAFAVRDRFPDGGESLGIPTWHYGHEPTNLFATAIAKYFRNAAREAILLEVCDAGIVFLPGAAGTVQEVFQDACENYYADERPSPRWCWSAGSTGPRSCRCGRCCRRWPAGGRWSRTCTSSTPSRTPLVGLGPAARARTTADAAASPRLWPWSRSLRPIQHLDRPLAADCHSQLDRSLPA